MLPNKKMSDRIMKVQRVPDPALPLRITALGVGKCEFLADVGNFRPIAVQDPMKRAGGGKGLQIRTSEVVLVRCGDE